MVIGVGLVNEEDIYIRDAAEVCNCLVAKLMHDCYFL